MRDFLVALFPVAVCFLVLTVTLLIVGLLLHANGFFIKGHYLVAMSGFCGKWLIRNCPYEVGDRCPCWNCPRATDRKDPCPVLQAQFAANRQRIAERKAARMARRKPQD